MSDDEFDVKEDGEESLPEGFHVVGDNVDDGLLDDDSLITDDTIVITPGSSLDDEDEEYNPLDDYSDDEWN